MMADRDEVIFLHIERFCSDTSDLFAIWIVLNDIFLHS